MPTPILLLIFNRPDFTRQVFECVRNYRPEKLFIAADGPRPHKAGEADACELARSIARDVDWDCEVRTLFRDSNLGCRKAVSEAITWFFENVEEGIILEDDCIPDQSFFHFCSELLDEYRNTTQVMAITGNNFQNGTKRGDGSYYFSIFPHCWGWATWRRAWSKYDRDFSNFPSPAQTAKLESLLSKEEMKYWMPVFKQASEGALDSWATIWLCSFWLSDGLAVTPNVNLVTNIGNDSRSAHHVGESHLLYRPTESLQTITKPSEIRRDLSADRYVMQTIFHVYKRPLLQRILDGLRRRLRSF